MHAEIGSHYQIESGLFITSFAAATFIAAIVTIGVLFITLVITLTVMLQSCRNSNAGLFQLEERSDQYNYCRIFALQAELNRLETYEYPSICKAHVIRNIKEGQYLRDLNSTMRVVSNYYSSLKPQADCLDVVLLDVEDILTSNKPYNASPLQHVLSVLEDINQLVQDKLQASVHILELYSKLQASGWSLIFITRKPEKLRNATIEALISSGYGSWSSLVMRSEDEMVMESWEYFSRRRAELQKLDFRISSVISSHMDALTGPCLGKRNFKLPRPLIYNGELFVNSGI
ncbi:hypothetical protein AQUCO_00900764v1 [Aquilegia coerulea]|uniref:Acid phosphatase n=1 Tax=Aquilegia coerulea TaxID=218851 RepID=A0A2G5EFE8_AQUCA|nr:hypothetical protein AQUCO_00900764v1 [Aquilegia coerulea]